MSRVPLPPAKRLVDLLVSSLLILGLLPIFALLALAVRVRLGSPVLFRQRRPGLHGRPFTMLKLRTMLDLKDAAGNLLPDERRLTGLGKFLRSTSLDELPELWCVLVGDMSLVGPRPLLLEYLDLYTDEQRRRHDVLPGITGWAQVNGRNAISWDRKFELDLWYVDNRSLLLDLEILWRTAGRVLSRHGINQDGEATMAKFIGTRDKT